MRTDHFPERFVTLKDRDERPSYIKGNPIQQTMEMFGKAYGQIFFGDGKALEIERGMENRRENLYFISFLLIEFCQHLMWFGMIVLKFIAHSDHYCVQFTEKILQPKKRDDARQMQDISRQETYPSNLVFFVVIWGTVFHVKDHLGVVQLSSRNAQYLSKGKSEEVH